MSATALTLPVHEAPDLKDFFAFIGFAAKPSSEDLPARSERIFRSILEVSEDLLLRAIREHEVGEFKVQRDAVFGRYIKSMVALGEMVQVTIPPEQRARLLDESLTRIEVRFKNEALPQFGLEIRDQALFTIWTIRKTRRVLAEIEKSGVVGEAAKSRDEALSREFSVYAWWSQFHLDCLLTAINFGRSIHPSVLEEIADGLRAAVNAHGIAKQSLDLRQRAREASVVESVDWDEEDQELLDASMRDLEHTSIDDER